MDPLRKPIIGPQTYMQDRGTQIRLKRQAKVNKDPNSTGHGGLDRMLGKNNPHGYKFTPAEKFAGTAALVKNMYNKQNKIEDRTSTFLNGKKK
tara:strand:+ start:97 stop:375 length:279 start_codon:yes stop_codon:yes gene_type:complete